MLRRHTGLLCLSLLFAMSGVARATQTFHAILTGASEVSPTGSTATGFGTVVLSDDHSTITVDESWTGLTGPATASHIHGPAPIGTNAPVLFPFTGVPAATAGSIPEQNFAITATQVSQLEQGLYYMNVHTGQFPGGEIRGQLLPEPATFSLLGFAGLGMLARRRRV